LLSALPQPLAAQGDEPVESRAATLSAARERPSLFVTATPVPGLRSLADLREGIRSGHAQVLWNAMKAQVDADLNAPPITPMREENGQTILGNRSFALVSQATGRILDTALVALVLEDRRYVESALRQMRALFDEAQWPEWSDQAHLNIGLNADLRHGQIVAPIALAYDWLYHQLSVEERREIIEGLERRAIAPYKKGFAAGEHWSRRASNWMTVVLGGFGIAGMALGPDHPDSAMLVANSLGPMESYLDALGPEGEFNESVQYAGSMGHVVRYFTAMRYASEGKDDPFTRHGLDAFYTWYMMNTFPPGRVAGFGDPAADMPPVVAPVAAVASATRNPVFQWFYRQYEPKMLESHRDRALELIYYDPTIEPQSPAGHLPLGRAYHAQGQLVSSRSGWEPDSCVSVVYGKSGKEDHHGHADWGQICLDGHGERLVVDLGAPPGYPKDKTERYYNYQQFGHNVFVFGNNETGGVHVRSKEARGRTSRHEFDEKRGAMWTFDLGEVYGPGYTVSRNVIHLLPRVAVVLDTATLPEKQPISLRWHLAGVVAPDGEKPFRFTAGKASLTGLMKRLDGETNTRAGAHAYAVPFNLNRLGEELAQKNEPYVELSAEDQHCRVVSIFAVGTSDAPMDIQPGDDNAWTIPTPEGQVEVRLEGDTLVVTRDGQEQWRVSP